MFESFFEIFERYSGGKTGYAVILGILAALIAMKKKSKTAGFFLALYVTTLLLVCNPAARLFWIRLIQPHIYWRMFWLLPTAIALSFVVTEAAFRASGWFSWVIVFTALLLLFAAGKNIYLNQNFEKATNPFKIPQSAASIGNYLLSEEKGQDTKVLAPFSLFCYLRQYSSHIHLLYGRNIEGYTSPVTDEGQHRLYEYMQSPLLDADQIFPAAGDYQCTYVILEDARPVSGDPGEYGYEKKENIGGYTLYKCRGDLE